MTRSKDITRLEARIDARIARLTERLPTIADPRQRAAAAAVIARAAARLGRERETPLQGRAAPGRRRPAGRDLHSL